MRKYFQVFKLGLRRETEYRLNFLLGRLRSIVLLLLFYFVWLSLGISGQFAGYTLTELFTYALGASILRSLIFGTQNREMSTEINDGSFSRYLVMPVNYFWYQFWREAAQKSANFLAAIFELILFIFIFQIDISIPAHLASWPLLFLSLSLAFFLYYLISYLVSMVAFWSREAMGPRFLFDWFFEFASGSYFPIDIVSHYFWIFFTTLPCLYVIYFPLSIYLERLDAWQIVTGLGIQVIFLILFTFLVRFFWQRGLQKYTGEGI